MMNSRISFSKQELLIQLDSTALALKQAEKALQKVSTKKNIAKKQPDMSAFMVAVRALNEQASILDAINQRF